VLCCAVLCCAVLCCAVLCCAVLCCAVLCCAVQHLGEFPHRLSQHCHALYEYTPPPPMSWPELSDEIWCHRYYLANLCDEERFRNWPVVEHIPLLQVRGHSTQPLRGGGEGGVWGRGGGGEGREAEHPRGGGGEEGRHVQAWVCVYLHITLQQAAASATATCLVAWLRVSVSRGHYAPPLHASKASWCAAHLPGLPPHIRGLPHTQSFGFLLAIYLLTQTHVVLPPPPFPPSLPPSLPPPHPRHPGAHGAVAC